jgi:nucleoside-diphosphate-sugar epimerase
MLLTGGTGFIGSRLALIATQRGMDVTVTGQTNSPSEVSRKSELEQAGVAVELGDLKDARFARKIVAGCNAVIHLAAAQHEANVPPSYFHELNVGGTRTLLEASRAAQVQRFVYGSTIGIYGSAGDAPLDENSPPSPVNPYGRSKLESEEVVREFGSFLETCVVRISETYGPGDMRLLKLFKGIQSGLFRIIGSGLNQHQLIHVRDLSRGLITAVEHPAAPGQTFIIAGREALTTREMIEQIAAALDRRPPQLRIPMWPFTAAAIVFETTCKPLGIQPPLHRRRLDFFIKSFLFSTVKSETVLGIKPEISFKEGAVETAAWYRKRGLLHG